jgi:precorrin-2/cobalt-factor-2 C20-methyltransferase
VQTGKLYGIGVGSGDPELITLKGLRILKKAPVVAFPAGLNGNLGIAQQIVLPWLQSHQRQLALTFPYVQDEAVLTQAWQLAAEQVWHHLAQTLQQLHPDVRVQAIPGVCSPLAAAAALGIPLTIRNQRLMVLPALYSMGELEAVLKVADVVALLKVSSVYEQVWAVLQQYGLLERSWVVERASLPNQVIYADLRDRPTLKLPYFSLLIVQVSEVANQR